MSYFLKTPIQIIIALFLFFQSMVMASEMKNVTMQLSWFNQFQFAGYYIAKEKGYYKDLGLHVEIKPFEFGLDIPKDVGEHKVDFAVGRETLILEKAKYKNIVALYALFQSSPLVLLSTKESKINSISDFKEKRVMATIDDASEVSLKAMISSHKVDLNDLKFIKHTHDINDLITKKTDVISAYTSKSPYILQKMNIEYNLFEPKEYGFDMYSDFLYTSEYLVANDAEMVRAFKKASLKGWEYAYANIEESVDLILEKYNTQNLSKEELFFEANELKKLSFYNTSTLGSIEKNKLKRIADLYNVMGLLDSRIDLDKFIYNEDTTNLEFTDKEKAYLKNKKSITMCIDPDWMPYEKFDSNGKYVGINADYFEIFQKSIGVPIEIIKTDTWSQSLEFAKSRKCDILSLAIKTQDRQKYLNFTEPYFDTSYVLATKPDIAFINDLKTLKNVKIGVNQNSAVIETLERNYPSITLVYVTNREEGLQKVIKGELFGFIDSFATIGYLLQRNFFGELQVSGKLAENFNLGVAVRNDDQVLLGIFNSIIHNLPFEVKEKIFNKYISIKYERGFDYALFWKIVIMFVFVILFLMYWNRTLKNKVTLKTLELQELNDSLETKIDEALVDLKEKDEMMILQSRSAAMGEMISMIAHQWRQPLSNIAMDCNNIIFDIELGSLDEKQSKEKLYDILHVTQHLSNTIDDFRDFFKPNKAKEKVFIRQIVDDALELIKQSLGAHFIECTVDCKDDHEIFIYSRELLQVLINILNNAQEALLDVQKNDRKISIDINLDKEYVFINISNNGSAIKEENLLKIFDPYFSTKDNLNGTGLGLYMSKVIIQKHMKGSISAKNTDFGVIFSIKIPIK